jgi:VWFA-related protein
MLYRDRHSMALVLFAALAASSPLGLSGRNPPQPPPAPQQQQQAPASSAAEPTFTFKASASFVRLDVQVVSGGKLVTDLGRDDFSVYDEGTAQPISYFGRESEPLTVLLLLDVSGSLSRQLDQVASQAEEALRFLKRGDRVGVMVFARSTRISEPFTTDLAEAAQAIRAAVHDDSVGSATLINPALLDAAAYMKTLDSASGESPGRRAVLIITDNFSMNYRMPDDEVIHALESANTVMNAIVMGKGHKPAPPRTDRPLNPDFTPADVFYLAEETGGEAVKADRPERIFRDMMERIRTRYTLQYRTPAQVANGYRHVKVLLSDAARRRYPEAEIRARRGYVVG